MIGRFVTIASILVAGSPAWGDTYIATILYSLAAPGGISIQPRQVTADGTVGYGPLGGSDPQSHALIWSPPDGAVTDLNPTDLGDVTFSQANGESGDQQVGTFGGSATGDFSHAVLWSSTAGSAVDLNPAQLGMYASLANGTDGIQQVGHGVFGTPTDHISHALLWTGTAASAVDLNPSQFGNNIGSVAIGVSDGHEVGNYSSLTIPNHAVLWNGTADSAVDLEPLDPSLEFSNAVATCGNEQVGGARANGGASQAFLWFGTAASAVNLNPTTLVGINSSLAVATNGLQQVGSGYDGSADTDDDQALVWSGSADSVVDLQPTLPPDGTWNFSDADSIDAAGNIFGTASGTFDGLTGYFAVEWSSVPEPASILLLLPGALLLLKRRMRAR
jgi:hypothetical protein